MPPRLPPYKSSATPYTTALLASMERQWHSPFARELGEAAALLAAGDVLKAALMLRQVIRGMEDRGHNFDDRVPVLRLSADAWSRVANRFAASSAEYTVGVRQRMRVDFLLEALADYMLLEDIPNQIRIYREIATVHLSGNRPHAAAESFTKAYDLARTHMTLQAREIQRLFSEMAGAYDAAFDRNPKSKKPEMAIRAAGFYQLLGDRDRAMTNLGKAHDRILEIAQSFHRMQQHQKASHILSQAVVLGIAAGRVDAVARHADLLVQYAILDGDQGAADAYDKAIRLAQSGMGEMADRLIQERALQLLNRPIARYAVEVFHGVVDLGAHYLSILVKNVIQAGNTQDSAVLEAALALGDATYWKVDAWKRTLDLFGPFQGQGAVEKIRYDGMLTLQAAAAEHDVPVKLAARYYRATRQPMLIATPALANLVADAELGNSEALHRIYLMIAREMKCSPAEVSSVFSPYGDAQLRLRLRGALGDLTFEQLRSKAMKIDFEVRRGEWEEFVREGRGRK